MFRLGWIAAASTLVLAACGASATHNVGRGVAARPRRSRSSSASTSGATSSTSSPATAATSPRSSRARRPIRTTTSRRRPTPRRSAARKLVVVNGLDYDPWADKAVATLDESRPS